MKVLFIDHECHRKTGSARFFLDILRQGFDVEEHYYSRFYRTGSSGKMKKRDVAVVWEFPVSRRRFFFPGKRNVFVPMYDNEWASFWQWKRIAWSGMGVISFCDKVSAHARRCGVENILDVRYFPDPETLPRKRGESKRVFLWERGEIAMDTVQSLFPRSAGFVLEVKSKDEFLPRRDYLDRLSECGIVVAPRRKEGIDMAFLEAMAMGKCVAAYDDATMNEYIKDGETGILFSPENIRPVTEDAVLRTRETLKGVIRNFRARWLSDAEKINDFILHQPECRPPFFNRLKITLSYPLFLLEGLFLTLKKMR